MIPGDHAASPTRVSKGDRVLDSFRLGVLMLDTRFPRITGDPGNSATYDFPVIFKVVTGARVTEIVRKSIDNEVAQRFVDAARELEVAGVRAITTSCGFLALIQRGLAESVKVPVLTSTLILAPLAYEAAGRPVGVLTADSRSLTRRHFEEVGVPPSVRFHVKGLEDKPEFSRVILRDSPNMDIEAMRNDVYSAAKELVSQHQDIGAILSECTNLAPFRKEIREATGLPVYDYLTLVRVAVDTMS